MLNQNTVGGPAEATIASITGMVQLELRIMYGPETVSFWGGLLDLNQINSNPGFIDPWFVVLLHTSAFICAIPPRSVQNFKPVHHFLLVNISTSVIMHAISYENFGER